MIVEQTCKMANMNDIDPRSWPKSAAILKIPIEIEETTTTISRTFKHEHINQRYSIIIIVVSIL